MIELDYLECHVADAVVFTAKDLLADRNYSKYVNARRSRYSELEPFPSAIACSVYEMFLHCLFQARVGDLPIQSLPSLQLGEWSLQLSESVRLSTEVLTDDYTWIQIKLEHFRDDKLIARECIEATDLDQSDDSISLDLDIEPPGDHFGRRWIRFELDREACKLSDPHAPEIRPLYPRYFPNSAAGRGAAWLIPPSEPCITAADEIARSYGVDAFQSDVSELRDGEWPSQYMTSAYFDEEVPEGEIAEAHLAKLIADPEFPIVLIADPSPLLSQDLADYVLDIHREIERFPRLLTHCRVLRITWPSLFCFNALVESKMQIAPGCVRAYYPCNFGGGPSTIDLEWRDLCVIAGDSPSELRAYHHASPNAAQFQHLMSLYADEPQDALIYLVGGIRDRHLSWNSQNVHYRTVTEAGEKLRRNQLDRRAANLAVREVTVNVLEGSLESVIRREAEIENTRKEIAQTLKGAGCEMPFSDEVVGVINDLAVDAVVGNHRLNTRFAALIGPLERSCFEAIKKRMQRGVPSGENRFAYFNPDFGRVPERERQTFEIRTRELRKTLANNEKRNAIALLLYCLSFATANQVAHPGGVWKDVTRAFSDSLDPELAPILGEVYRFRNTSVAHPDHDGLDLEGATQQLVNWVKVLEMLDKVPTFETHHS